MKMQRVFHRSRFGRYVIKGHDSDHVEGRERLRASWGRTDCCCKHNRNSDSSLELEYKKRLENQRDGPFLVVSHSLKTAPWERT